MAEFSSTSTVSTHPYPSWSLQSVFRSSLGFIEELWCARGFAVLTFCFLTDHILFVCAPNTWIEASILNLAIVELFEIDLVRYLVYALEDPLRGESPSIFNAMICYWLSLFACVDYIIFRN